MKKFKKVYIEITNVCNLACSFCPKTQRAPEFMKLESFSRILDQVKEYTDYIYFHVKGEPLLHPEIDKFFDLTFEKGLKVILTTNGTLLSKVKHKILGKPALRQVNISLHSFDANEKATNMDDYLNSIINFAKEAVEVSSTIVALRLWNLSESNITNLERQRNRHILEIIEKAFNLEYRIEEKITEKRGIKLSERTFLNQDYEFKWPDLKEEEDEGRGFCYGLRNQIAILVDGTVVPCCLDGEGVINLGNINRISFSEIIDGERSRNMVEGFSGRKCVEELCRKCGYRRRFNL
jgi:radical SAM protein with 4Fe4S-binding SPASM domain